MERKVYFGNDSKQTWIDAPQTGLKVSTNGWMSDQTLLNGRAFIKRSEGNHRRFSASWLGSLNAPEIENSLHTIKDFSDGIYGDGPFYWNDPYAMKTNLFSPAWASPFMFANNEWGGLFPPLTEVNMTSYNTASLAGSFGSNDYGYPASTLFIEGYSSSTFESKSVTFIIPAGYTLWLGVHGSANDTAAGGAFVTSYDLDGVEAINLRLSEIRLDSASRFGISFDGDTTSKVKFKIAKTSSSYLQLFIAGLFAQMLPTGVTPDSGNFITGRGTTGLEFSQLPQIDYYSANINNGQVGMSVNWAEI